MLYYTIVPPESLFAEEAEQGERRLLEVRRGGATMLVAPTARGNGRIERLISTDPHHYLDPAFQPGAEVSILPDEVVKEWVWPSGDTEIEEG